MAEIKALFDEYGVINEAVKILPDDELKMQLVEALAELEDGECHRTPNFPKTRLHKVIGVTQAIYRADVNKISGWRIHVMYKHGAIHLKDIVQGQKHDDVLKVIKSKKYRYA
jgi:hypothetical protein